MTFKLRPYQQKASDTCLADLKTHNKSIIVLPTGTGKTEIFIEITKQFQKTNPGKAALILSHLEILTGQTKERFSKRFPKAKVGILKYGERPSPSDDVIIGTMQSGSKKYKMDWIDNRLAKEIGLIIIDEAHYITTDSYQKVMSFYPEAKIVGMTATPFKENKVMTNFFDVVSYSASLQEMIDEKYLVPPKLFSLPRPSDDIEKIMSMIVGTYKQNESGKNAIVFMRTIKEAKEIRNVFESAGVSSHTITSGVKGKTRAEHIESFNRGKLKVLTTVDVLTAGFDSPICSSIFMPFATKSVSKYLQRVGRGLRLYPGKECCNVYVYGSTPDIDKSFYEKIQNQALNKNGKIKQYDTFKEDFNYNEYECPQTYEWNQTIVTAIDEMNKINMGHMAKILNEKKFPKVFMENIKNILDNLPKREMKIPHGYTPATPVQRQKLQDLSFEYSAIEPINRNEAAMMIKAIKGPEKGQFAVPNGRFEGYHIAETPFKYREYVSKNFPSSHIAKIIRAWNNYSRAK